MDANHAMFSVFANIGIPMLMPQWILMGLAFLPIVLIESWIIGKSLGRSAASCLKDVVLANFWTTLIGVPLAWGAMLGLNLLTPGGYDFDLDTTAKMLTAVTLQAAWLAPYEGNLFWVFPAASTFLLLPCFVMSVIIEWWVLTRRWRDQNRKRVLTVVLRANVWSYLCLLCLGILWFVASTNR